MEVTTVLATAENSKSLRNPMRPAEKSLPGLEQPKYDLRKYPGTVTVEEGAIIHMCPNGEKEKIVI